MTDFAVRCAFRLWVLCSWQMPDWLFGALSDDGYWFRAAFSGSVGRKLWGIVRILRLLCKL